ncbi:hypothetical protein QBC36DRAFT_229583 [Triangularia setosa]|uniref:SET domain-containing protein n=1 Tax=Triangularia setosa TaxID=2587417 RepID=A0AAN7ACB8_9PEZI|nr:hypothetical protein QBC36DRAFT_229583 [Podospora setosa]
MNTHQAQDFPQILAHIEEQKRMLRNAQSQAGQRPARKIERIETIRRFNVTRMSGQRNLQSDLSISFIPSPYAPCAQPFCDLKKIMVDDLVLETHHRGTFLLVRVVTPQDRITAVMAIVEDERGEVLLLQLYHQVETTEDILVPGRVLIIRDPYLKLTADGKHGLRVDHVSDIVFLPVHEDRIPACWRSEVTNPQNQSAGFWKAKGNDCFGQSRYHAAIEYYTSALASSPTTEECHTIKLNRSLAFLKTNHFDAALADVDSMLSDSSAKSNEKALFRKAQALYSLQRYRECCEVLKTLRLKYPDNTAAKDKLNEAVNRLAEQTTGKYRFKKLHAEAAHLRPPQLDHATHIGPVGVRQSESRGRGLFTTKAVKAGDLLFCEKAFVYAFHEGEGMSSNSRLMMNLLIDVNANSFTTGAQPELITMLVQKLYQNPSLASIVKDLHRGSYSPVQGVFDIIDGKPVIDSFLLTRILLINSFGCRLSGKAGPLKQANGQPINVNNFNDLFPSLGIWTFASHINHSCTSNAFRSFIGDMMILRANQDLPANAEVTIQYLNPFNPERQQVFVKNWAFACDCVMCQDNEQTSDAVVAKRKRLGESLQSMLRLLTRRGSSSSGAGSIASLVRKSSALIAEMEGTYNKPAKEVPRLVVWKGYRDFACALTLGAGANPQKIVELSLRALRSLGFVIEGGSLGTNQGLVVREWGFIGDGLLDCWMCLKAAYVETRSYELALAAEGYAKVCYKILFGEDETFGELD